MLDIGRPEDHWDGETEAQPKLVTKHGDRVSGVTVVTRVGFRNLVTGMWVRHLSMGFVCHVVHFELTKRVNRTPLGLRSSIRTSDHRSPDAYSRDR